MTTITQDNLIQVLWPNQTTTSAPTRYFTLLLVGVILLSASAKISIPFIPVPITLQTLVLLVLGMAYGFRLATSTALSYLALGVAGVPVFASGAGWAYFIGPTGGYLVGFVFAMSLMGFLGDRGWGKSIKSMIVPMLLGTVIIFVLGVTWLGYLIGYDKAIAAGLLPFIPGEILKIIVALFLIPSIWKFTLNKKNK